MSDRSSAAGGGFTLGTLIAVAISWSANHSIIWAIIHGFFSWFYIIYYLLGGGHHGQ